MEIRDYLRAIRRVLWLVIAVPVIAGLLVGGFIELQPSVYQADATAVVPAITANGISQSAASQYASTFKDVLTSQQVIPEVAQKFNIPQAELLAGLSSSTATASSNLINIVLVGKKGQNLVGAVHEATVDTMNAIAEPQLVLAQNEVTDSRTLLQNAQTAVFNFDAQYANISPQVAYNNEQTTLSQKEAELQTAIINNDAAREGSLTATIASIKNTLAKLGSEWQQYQPLASALSAAQAANDHANTALVGAQSLIATDSAPGTVTTRNVGRLSKLSDVIKFAAIGFALALIMMLGLILILELMRSGKRQAVPAGEQQGAFAWAPPASAETRAAGPPAAPAMAGTAAAGAARDPWRATPAPGSDGHGNGNGNGNGHAGGDAQSGTDAGAEAQRTGPGLSRR
jgi:capsular polysaccharide biosynthesis protein